MSGPEHNTWSDYEQRRDLIERLRQQFKTGLVNEEDVALAEELDVDIETIKSEYE